MRNRILEVFIGALMAVLLLSANLYAQDPAPDPLQVDRLVDELGSESWKSREKASEALEKMGTSVLVRLKERLAATSDEEIRIRLEALIEKAEAILEAARIDTERAVNVAVWMKNRDNLRSINPGKWFVIADGALIGPADDFDAIIALARDKTAKSAHRFVFQAGSDARDNAEPEVHGSLRSGDIGPGVGSFSNFAFVDGKPFVVDPEKGLVPIPPANYSSPETARKGKTSSLEIPVFINTGFPGQVCLDPAAALALRLHRFEIPGEVEGGTLDSGERPGEMLFYPARRAWVCVKFGHVPEPRRLEALVPRLAEKK